VRTLRAEGIEITRWVSFAAHDVSDGGMYLAAGFTVRGHLKPDYWYAGSSTCWRRKSKESYQKKRFKTDATLEYREGLTERELAELNGLTRVWDSGKTCFEAIVPDQMPAITN